MSFSANHILIHTTKRVEPTIEGGEEDPNSRLSLDF